MYIFHDSRDSTYRSPFGAVTTGSRVTLRLKLTDCIPTAVTLRLWTDHESLVPMTSEADGFFTAGIDTPDTPCLLWYYFIVETRTETVFYGHAAGALSGTGEIMASPESWQVTVYRQTVLPEWYRNSVVYQIFPDRFARGSDFLMNQELAAHPEGWKGTKRMVMQDWNDTPFYCRDAKNRVIRWPFFGGSFRGIIEKLPYLCSLGIGTIYLNPIFLASSNHKYDTADYMQIDPTFGTEEDLQALCSQAAACGIRIILDGVFSHTGDDSIYFNRYGNYPGPGAYGSEESPYDSWYRFDPKYECGYESWWGVDSLPDVEETNSGYQAMICGENGVIRKWLRAGASGWRLDVADELPDSFIAAVRKACKAEKTDSLLMGEVWEDASCKISYNQLREYLLGDELDCTMHYPFRTHAIDFVLDRENAGVFSDAMSQILEHYPPEAIYGALNLIGTHDTVRILTLLGEAPEKLRTDLQEQYRLPEAEKQLAIRRLKLLQVLQFVSPGVPSVYYGDEAGMQGYADPYNRATFPWGNTDADLEYHVRMLSHFRRDYPVLVSGTARYHAFDDSVVGIERTEQDTHVIALCNRASFPIRLYHAALQGTWLELCTGKTVTGPALELPPYGYMILYRRKDTFEPEIPSISPAGTGILCPLFSLPGENQTLFREGTATKFLDMLHTVGCRNWMLLPLNPVGEGNSPYSSKALFAGEPSYVSLQDPVDDTALAQFIRNNAYWLDDYALYTVLHEHFDAPWQQWPEEYRDRKNLNDVRTRYSARIQALYRQQYLFDTQWNALHAYANSLGISLIGDIPVYAALDSADAWAHPELFQLNAQGYTSLRAGCPPDYFSPDGQDWGNPLYRWDVMKQDRYFWWKQRLGRALHLYDYIRLDHFRGFSSYYAIPEKATAKEGYWMPGPGMDFFRELSSEFGTLPFIAEDLGALDSMVTDLLKQSGFCGMNVWQYSSPEMTAMTPEERKKRIFFSGTHDNQTLRGFLDENWPEQQTAGVLEWLKHTGAAAVIVPAQDILNLDDSARINVPGIPKGNWTWKMTDAQLDALKETGFFR